MSMVTQDAALGRSTLDSLQLLLRSVGEMQSFLASSPERGVALVRQVG